MYTFYLYRWLTCHPCLSLVGELNIYTFYSYKWLTCSPCQSTACDVKLALNGHFVLIIVDNSQWLLYLKSDLIIHYMSGYIKSISHYYIPVHNSSVITKIIFLRELLSFYSPITLRGTDLSWCVPHCSPENSQQGSQFWQLGRLHWPPQPPCSSNQKSPANPPCLWSDNPTIALPTAHPVWGTKKEKSLPWRKNTFFSV